MKRILSIILALLMVATVIPAGIVSVTAEESDGADRQVIQVWNEAKGEGTISFLWLLEQYTPDPAVTAEEGGEDTYVEPSKPQMKNPLQKNTTYLLMEDIDLGGIELTGAITAIYEEYTVQIPPAEEGGEPTEETKKRIIGYEGTGFIDLVDGVIFDGQGHSISNFKLAGSKDVSLFNAQTGNGADATIAFKNISFGIKTAPVIFAHNGVTQHNQKGMALIYSTDSPTTINFEEVNAYVDGSTVGGAWQEHGVFVGRNWGALNFKNCSVDGAMTTHGYFGSFVSIVKDRPVTFEGCVNNLDITVKGSGWVGGFVGKAEGSANYIKITDCINNGVISGERATGGFVGEIISAIRVEITDSANHGAISGKTRGVGGAIGVLTDGKVLVENFVNSASVTASGAGAAGAIVGGAEGAYVALEVTEAINGGVITANKGSAGGVIGGVTSAAGDIKITDFINLSKISATATGGAAVGNATNSEKANNNLTISVFRLVNTGDIYGKLGAGAITGGSQSATLNIIGCISTSQMSADGDAADCFAKFESDPENDIPDAKVLSEENIIVFDAKTNTLGIEKAEAQTILEALKERKNGYFLCDYSYNEKSGRIFGDIRPEALGVQLSLDDGSARLVGAIHSLNYKQIGVKLRVDGGEVIEITSKNVFRELKATDKDGASVTIEAWELGGAYLYAIPLDSIPMSGDHTLTVIPFARKTDGSEFCGFDYTVRIVDGKVSENNIITPEKVPAKGSSVAAVFSESDIEKMEIYQSNTIAATGNNGVLTSTTATTKRFRAIFKAQEYGEFEYSLMFSNNVDSTWGGSPSPTCTPDTQAHPYRIIYAKLGTGKDVTSEMTDSVELTFDGNTEKSVAPGEIYWSDPVTLDLPRGEMIVFEWEVEYDLIPATNICGTFYGANYVEKTNEVTGDIEYVYESTSFGTVPLPDLIGAKRENQVRMAFLGDSITMGQGAGIATYKFYAAQVAELAGKDISCWNLGLGYARANDLLYSRAWLEKAKQNDIVVVCLGTNDVNSGVYHDIYRDDEEIYADILAVCDELTAAGCEVILLSTPPFGYGSEQKKENCLALGELLKALAEEREYEFIDTVALWGKSGDMATSKYPASGSDYHPNADGCSVLAQAFVDQGIIIPALPDIDSDFPLVKDEEEDYWQSPIIRPRPGDVIK